MNIPLNIDWQQILLHLLNFAVLSLGLYLLLYKPVKNFMDKREEHYRALNSQTEIELKQAQDLKNSYTERLEGLESEIENKRALAVQETKQAIDSLMQNAKNKASKIIENAQETALVERERILDESTKEIAAMAIAATEKLLANSASDTLDQFLYAVKKE